MQARSAAGERGDGGDDAGGEGACGPAREDGRARGTLAAAAGPKRAHFSHSDSPQKFFPSLAILCLSCYDAGMERMDGAKVVAYVRVSTQRQGESGLGLEAQREAVRAWCARVGAEVVRECVDVESGRSGERPQLREALEECRRSGALLLIAKLDRLARNVAFIAALMESDVEFRCCDMPEASRLLLHVMAAVAEHEARMISMRTREALAAAKRRGVLLGAAHPRGHRFGPAERSAGAMMQRSLAIAAYREIAACVRSLRAQGESYERIAKKLNEMGFRTRNGATFEATTVRRLFLRAAPAA